MKRERWNLLRIGTASVLLVVLTAVLHHRPLPWQASFGLYLVVYAWIGYEIVLEAIGGIVRGQLFDENFLMVLATIGAFATGQYPEAVSVMLLYQIGELFQRYAVGKSRGSISELMDLRPDTAMLLEDGVEREVLPEEVEVGQVILVRPGERVPLDGVVLRGSSTLDTAALTGEAIPRPCAPGDQVLSGVIVLNGQLELQVTKAYYDSTVAKILDMVENAAGKKAKSETFITRFSRYYTPVVVALAVVLALVPPLLLGGSWRPWIQKALNFLVVSCPCALVISVPMSFFCGIGAASRNGVLVKGGSYLELLARADIFVFDKTGTLTEGRFSVSAVVPEDRREEILAAAAIAERGSLHPIAQSILQAAGDGEGGWNVTEQAGHGMVAEKDGHRILAGNLRLLQQWEILAAEVELPGTVVYVAKDGKFLGAIVIRDCLKPDSVEAVAELRRQGAKTVMLTGDTPAAAKQIAEQVGVSDYMAGLLPGDKVVQVERLLAQKVKHSKLAFVGDGINDAPVLMRADVGIAMGAIGSDAAIEAADVVLMHDQLSSIAAARRIAKKTISIVRQNIVFALGTKLLVLALTPFGLVTIWLAIFADVGVAVLAILNAMRAGRVKTTSETSGLTWP